MLDKETREKFFKQVDFGNNLKPYLPTHAFRNMMEEVPQSPEGRAYREVLSALFENYMDLIECFDRVRGMADTQAELLRGKSNPDPTEINWKLDARSPAPIGIPHGKGDKIYEVDPNTMLTNGSVPKMKASDTAINVLQNMNLDTKVNGIDNRFF